MKSQQEIGDAFGDAFGDKVLAPLSGAALIRGGIARVLRPWRMVWIAELGWPRFWQGMADMAAAIYLCAERQPWETMTAYKKRRAARRDYIRAQSREFMDDARADQVWDNVMSRVGTDGGPTVQRAEKASRIGERSGMAMLGGELPAGIQQLLRKEFMTLEEGELIVRFRAHWDQAYYSGPGMTTRYEERIATSSSHLGGQHANAVIQSARDAMIDIQASMSERCWRVLTQMAVFDVAQVTVGAEVSRYKDAKGQRHTAGTLLLDAISALKKAYD